MQFALDNSNFMALNIKYVLGYTEIQQVNSVSSKVHNHKTNAVNSNIIYGEQVDVLRLV